MKVLTCFRVDGGKIDGLGHLKRCIFLSKEIKKNSLFKKPFFIVNKKNKISKNILNKNQLSFQEVNGRVNTKRELNELIKILKNKKPKILIIDSKRIDKEYIVSIKKYCKVVIFEDEKTYNSNPHLIVNSNVWFKKMYVDSKNKLLGLKYNTISNNFFKKNTFNENSKKILISLGGEDPQNISLKILKIVHNLISGLKFVVILGHSHPNKKSLYNFSKKNNVNLKIINSPEDISKYLINLKFVISAGGLSAYEFASAGIPQLISILDNHQRLLVDTIINKKCGEKLIESKIINKKKIKNKFINFYNNTSKLLIYNKNTKKFIKKSGCEAIVKNIIKLSSV